MNENEIENLKKDPKYIYKFIEKYKTTFEFSNLTIGLRNELWLIIFTSLINDDLKQDIDAFLTAIRILSRDKNNLNETIKDEWITILLNLSELNNENQEKTEENKDSIRINEVIVGSLKCLCNLVFNSTKVLNFCSNESVLNNVSRRLNNFRFQPKDVTFFDIKLLFIITALNSESRTKVQITECLIDILQTSKSDKSLQVETLKLLYNILSADNKSQYFENLSRIISLILLENERYEEVISHAVNLLTVFPEESLEFLHNEGLKVLLEVLETKLKAGDTVAPVLMVLINCAKKYGQMRKWLKSQVLPPLVDIHNRPEEGDTLRNRLCRLLTSPIFDLRDLSSEFLFVLCKENPARMIKYTGYGNSAGFFARRGLSPQKTTEYSSSSEDSDTEEYKKHRDEINAVLGCYAPKQQQKELEEMSDERKEYEAEKLAQLLYKLTDQGIIRPCKLNEEGKPEPIEHILQLQKDIPSQNVDNDD